MIKDLISQKIVEAIKKASSEGKLGQLTPENVPELFVEKTKNPEFGDYAVNISSLAKFARISPVQIAEAIKPFIEMEDAEISIISGFVNFKTGNKTLNNVINEILNKKEFYGSNNQGNYEKVMLEYVSANPTGPLHIGHGRWAAVGSSLANLMKFSGYDVTQEFYINDAGNQINNLGKSLWIRVLQEMGIKADFPQTEEEGSKNYYAGEFLISPAKEYLKNNKEKAEEFYKQNNNPLNPSAEVIKTMSDFAKALMLKQQQELLAKFGTHFDVWYRETSLHQSGEVEKTIEKLQSLNKLYKKEDAVWFKSSEYGDDQDRVIKKSDGTYTYLTADIAYHYDKIQRGFQRLINIWGADHHGYIPRIKASIEALGGNPDCLEVLLGQLVNLIISGEQVRMGKRKKMLTLEELIDEVGVDGTRFWMIMRSIDTTLDFDVDLAKSCSDENPVFYVQYAHARVCSILRTAIANRIDRENQSELPPFFQKQDLELLFNKENSDRQELSYLWKINSQQEIDATKALILKLESFEDVVFTAAKLRTPYLIARYTQELAKDFHHFYTFTRVLNVEENLMKARLCLIDATRQTFVNAFKIIGISAPESM